MGEIIAKDNTSVTVKLTDGGSKIVFYSDKTTVQEMKSGSIADLQVGDTVNVSGTANSDGSITAESFQKRPPRPQDSTNAPTNATPR